MKRRPRTTGGLAAAEARGKSWSCLCQAANPFSPRWDESQHKRSGHCCSIDYQWKMSDSLSQASLFNPFAHRQTELDFFLLFVSASLPRKNAKSHPIVKHSLYTPVALEKPIFQFKAEAGICRDTRYHSSAQALPF